MTALFVARPLFPSESAAAHGDGISVVMLWLALAVFWLIAAIGRPGFSTRFGWIDAGVVLLLLCQAAAALWAVSHGSPRPAINVFWEWVGLGLCFLLARQLIDAERESRALAAVMIALAVGLSVYGLYQRAYEMPVSRALYHADPDAALRDAGTWFPPGSPQRKLFEDRLANDEPMATFALTNSLAGFLAPWLTVLLGIACSELPNRKRLLGALALAVPVAICLYLTHSRSGNLAALLGLALVWPLVRGKPFRFGWKIPAAIILAGVVLLALAASIGKLDYETAHKSFGYRLQYWRSSISMIADHPWLGCGPGNYQETYTRYKLPEASEEVADPHNFLLEIWATAGTPAALAFLAVLGFFACKIVGGEGRGARDWGRGRNEENEKCKLSEANADAPNPRIPESRAPRRVPPIPCPPSTDGWLFVLIGGAVGFLLSLPLGMIGAASPGIMPVVLSLPSACIAIALLFGWIRDGRMPRLLPALAVVVLLINLLAAGGISYAGVAGSLWLLMALGLQGERPKSLHAVWAWTALAGMLALGAVCYRTAYSPVLACHTLLHLSEKEPARAEDHLAAAATADPWSAEPWRRMAIVELDLWNRSLDKDAFRRFEQAAENLSQLNPNSSNTWSMIGDWYSQAAMKTDPIGKKAAPDAASKALAAYKRAVELYPNSAIKRAKLAEAYRTEGEPEAFRREAETALRLDTATPHADKKLPDDVRSSLTAKLAAE